MTILLVFDTQTMTFFLKLGPYFILFHAQNTTTEFNFLICMLHILAVTHQRKNYICLLGLAILLSIMVSNRIDSITKDGISLSYMRGTEILELNFWCHWLNAC